MTPESKKFIPEQEAGKTKEKRTAEEWEIYLELRRTWMKKMKKRERNFYESEVIKRENKLLKLFAGTDSIRYHDKVEEGVVLLNAENALKKYNVFTRDKQNDILFFNPDYYDIISSSEDYLEKKARTRRIKVIIPAYFRKIGDRNVILRKGAGVPVEKK